jgi:hypothetical protein
MLRTLFTLLFCLPAFIFAQNSTNLTDQKVVSGLVLLDDKSAPSFKKILESLPTEWLVRTDSVVINDKMAVFSTPGATVMMSWLNYPANPEETQMAASISWLWKNAELESRHQTQVVVSVLGNPAKTVELYRIFTRVTAAVLINSPKSTGVMMSDQYLLVSKGYYLEAARSMGAQGFPLYCWMYFGLLQDSPTKSSAYTYGMSEFGLPELELVQGDYSVQDAHALVYQTATFALQQAKPVQSGQTLDLGEGRKVTLRLSDAKLIREQPQTLKVE